MFPSLEQLPITYDRPYERWNKQTRKSEKGTEAVPLTIRELERPAQREIVSVLRLVDAGKVAVSVESQLRIAFDGDAVIFSDEAERVYKQDGLAAFNHSEKESAGKPLPGGPFRGFLAALHQIQGEFPPEQSPIRTALVTARGAPAHERVIRTLRAWDIRIDEALFLGGLDKGPFLETFQADIFFDDQHRQSTAQTIPAVPSYCPASHQEASSALTLWRPHR